MTDKKIVFKKPKNDNDEYSGAQCFQINPNVVEREIPTNGEEYLLKVIKERAQCATVTRCNIDVSKLDRKCDIDTMEPAGANGPSDYEKLKPTIEWQNIQIADFSDVHMYVIRMAARRKESLPSIFQEAYKGFIKDGEILWKKVFETTEPTLCHVVGLTHTLVESGLDAMLSLLQRVKPGESIDRRTALWLHALLTVTRNPPQSDESFLLRNLCRRCAEIRAALNHEDENSRDLATPMNIFICIIAKYFGQHDLDLQEAKEEARRQDWDRRLPEYHDQVEEKSPGSPQEEEPTAEEERNGIRFRDDWVQMMDAGGTCGEGGEAHEDSDINLESEDLDDEEDSHDPMSHPETSYLLEGETEFSRRTGALSQKVKDLLSGPSKDVKVRRVEVDLSYIGQRETRHRTLKILEELVKTYTSVPGKVEVVTVSDKGIYSLNVTNTYLSPTSDSSESPRPTELKGRGGSKPTPQKASPVVYHELIKGIKLTPKFPGLAAKTLKYGKDGLTLEGIQGLKAEYPEASWNEIIGYALKLSGQYVVMKLYRLP